MVAQLAEPSENRRVTRKGPEANLVEWLNKAQNLQRLVLSDDRPSGIGTFFAQVAKQVIPARCEGRDSTRFRILWSADTVPPIYVEILPLHCHLLPCYELTCLEF